MDISIFTDEQWDKFVIKLFEIVYAGDFSKENAGDFSNDIFKIEGWTNDLIAGDASAQEMITGISDNVNKLYNSSIDECLNNRSWIKQAVLESIETALD